jgi:hypothetical protein
VPEWLHASGIVTDTLDPVPNFYAGDEDPFERVVTLAQGQNLTRGAVLGMITATGLYTLSTAAAADGSQNPAAVLRHDCDATAANTDAVVVEKGTINELVLVWGTGQSLTAAMRETLRGKGLRFRQNLRAQ